MGEIGRDRHEFLYEMQYWEILLIIRGYRRRGVLQYQLQRMQVFASTFAFAGNKDGKKPQDLWPLYFDHYKTAPAISEEDRKELLDLINNENKK